MKVLIVMMGETGEGGSVRGVFLEQDWEKAEACALSQRAHFGPWEPSCYAEKEWTSGCDWVAVKEYDVTL